MSKDYLIKDPRSIRIVLVGTTHAGNIGAAARAMKTMGLATMFLVAPQADHDSEEAQRRSAGAEDILASAVVVQDLLEAISGCRLVVGTSARSRAVDWPTLDPTAAAEQLVAAAATGPVALLFGPERTGLDNFQVERCHALVTIPANPEYSSLNLASAVQIMAYEIRRSLTSDVELVSAEEACADPVELDKLYRHLADTLNDLDFIKSSPSTKLLRKFVRLINRAHMRSDEVDLLRGVLAAAQAAARGAGKR